MQLDFKILKDLINKKHVKLVIGLVLIVSGIVFQIYDWGSGEDGLHGGYFSFIISAIIGFGVFMLFRLKHNINISTLYGLMFVLIIGIIFNCYSYFYLTPQIEKNGEITKGIVIKVYKKYGGNGSTWSRGIYYKYSVNGKVYFKSKYSDSLQIGDTIVIKYYILNPNFHLSNKK